LNSRKTFPDDAISSKDKKKKKGKEKSALNNVMDALMDSPLFRKPKKPKKKKK